MTGGGSARRQGVPAEQVLARDRGAAGGGPAHPRRAAVRLRLRPGGGRARRAGHRRLRHSRARQRPRPDRLPVRCWPWRTRWSGPRPALLGGGPGAVAPRGRQRDQRRHRVADPAPSRRPGTPARRSPNRRRGPGHRPRRVRQGGALPAGAAGAGAGLDPAPCARIRPTSPPRSPPTRCWSPARRRRTRTGWSTRSPTIAAAAAGRRACAATSTPASAAGRCRTCAGSACRCRAFDFSVPGVTSISVDLHKYAYCPEGRLGPAAPRRGAAGAAVLRLRRLARLHDGQPDRRVHPVGRADRGRLRDAAPPRRRRLPAARRATRDAVRRPGRRRVRGATGCG